jgi:hypothetical protein
MTYDKKYGMAWYNKAKNMTEIEIADKLMEAMYDDDWKCHECANQWIGIIHNWTGKEYED